MATATATLSFTPCPADPTPRQLSLALTRAYRAWRALQDRAIHPDGTFDDAGRWYPDGGERCDCCAAIRGPSRAYPYSYLTHCRSVEHVAARFRVEPSALRRKIRRMEPPRPAAPPADHYKLVAVVDGRMVSVYDGETEYRLGETLRQPCKPGHGGGYYCYAAPDHARREFPPDAALSDAPMALVRVKVGGRKLYYGDARYAAKVAFSELTPVEILWTEAPING